MEAFNGSSNFLYIHTHVKFKSLTVCAVISEEVMVNYFLPGLRCLHADMEQLSPEHEVSRCNTLICSGGFLVLFTNCLPTVHKILYHICMPQTVSLSPSFTPIASRRIKADSLTSFTLTDAHLKYLFASRSRMLSISCEHLPNVTNNHLIFFPFIFILSCLGSPQSSFYVIHIFMQ